MKPTVAVLLGLLVAPAVAAEPTVRGGHPRIYVTPDMLPALRARSQGPLKDVYAAMQKADWIMRGKPGVDWSDCTNVGYPAFLYLLTDQKPYAAKVREFLDALSARPPRDQYLTPAWIRSGVTACDWVWNDLTPAERAKYARTLLEMADWVLTKVWRHSDFNNHFVNEHLAVLYVAVLLDGEGIEPDRVARLMKTGREYLLDHAMPAADEIAGELERSRASSGPPWARYLARPGVAGSGGAWLVGGQAEGFSYNDWGYARPLALACEMWRVATGQDLFQGSSFFVGQSVWHAYALRPDSGTFARSEDCPSGFAPGANLKTFMHLLGARLNDPLAEWLAQRVRWKYVQVGWEEILFRDANLVPRSPAEMRLPAAACFGKLGHAYFRSRWGDANAAFAMFQCGPFYAGHQHLDNNTFVIHRGGSLAIDSGTNDYGPHRGNYYCRTIAHNGVLVHDPQERFSAAAWSAQGAGGSNDGGQMRGAAVERAGQFQPGGPSDVGRIVAFADGRYGAAVLGDATRSYSPRKVRSALRAFYHLRGDADASGAEDAFVVYDSIQAAREDYAQTWILHSISRPEVEGGRFTVTHGRGRLTGQVLLPEDPQIRLVGGEGKDSTVEGRNYPPTEKKPDPEHGGWRMEVPLRARALVVLRADLTGSPAPPPLKPEPTAQGLLVPVRLAGLEYRVLLPAGGGLPQVQVLRAGQLVESFVLTEPPAPG